MTELFGTHFTEIEVADLIVRLRGTPAEIWHRLVPNYDIDLLSPAGQDALRSAFLDRLSNLVDKQGLIECSIGLRSVLARKS